MRVVELLIVAALITLVGCEVFPRNAKVFSKNKYAIVVGINDYILFPDGLNNDLKYCVADAESMKNMLEEAGWTVKLIASESNESINRFATKSAIENALKIVPSDTESFMFYYSGHGFGGADSKKAYIIPSDYNYTATSMISTSELAFLLEGVSAKNKIIILDSCYSGGFVDPADSSDAVPGDYVRSFSRNNVSSYLQMLLNFGDLLAKNIMASGISASSAPLVISAAGWDEVSEEDPYVPPTIGHGYFSYFFLGAAEKASDGYMKGDADRDNVLSCLEAYSYAKTALESSGYDFLPHISGGLRDFALIDNRGN